MQVQAEAELTREDRVAVERAVAQFNRGLFFECHEILEDVWRDVRGPSRDFLQGLIQVSVGFHHLDRGNRVGALRTFAKALGRLEAYPARYLGFDVAGERVRLEDLRKTLEAAKSAALDAAPTWCFEDLPLTEGTGDDWVEATAQEDPRD